MPLAQALEHGDGIVVDAIDREHHQIGARQRGRELALALLDAAVVRDDLAARPFDQRADRRTRARPSADVDDAPAVQDRPRPVRALVAGDSRSSAATSSDSASIIWRAR